MPRRSRTPFVLLGLLSSEPMTGYQLKAAIERSVGHFWMESYGQLYPALKQLEQQGWVRGKDQAGGRSRIVYAITARGREELRRWLREPPSPTPPRSELLLKVFFGKFAGDDVLVQQLTTALRGAEQEVQALTGLAQMVASSEPDAPELTYWLLTVDLGRRIAEARADWAKHALQAIQGEQ